MSSPLAVPGARATLVLSLVMSLLGITGMMFSYAFLQTQPASVATAPSAMPQEVVEAQTAMSEEIVRSPVLKGLWVANLLASMLLVVASFLLTLRRPSALWWTRQSLLANVLYTLGGGVAVFWFIHHHESLFAAVAAADAVARHAPDAETIGAMAPTVWSSTWACGGALMLGLYLVMLRVSRREDVQRFVRREVA